MTARYDISVQTTIVRTDGSPFWTDKMRWADVDEEIRVWLAGSCKQALFRLISKPEVTEGESYTLQYRTIVYQGTHIVSDTSLVEFPRLSYETVVEFEHWAIEELRTMLKLMTQKHVNNVASIKPRNRMLAFLSILKQVIVNKWSNK